MGIQHGNIGFSWGKSGLLPQEEKLAIENKFKKLRIGIPRDNELTETRVPLTPEAVEILVNEGHDVLIESCAGKSANYLDKDYSERGGFIVQDKHSIYQCDIILKVAPISLEEADILRGQQTIISSLIINTQTATYFHKLAEKKVTAIAFEYIRDESENFPVVRSMNAISGSTAVLIAAEYLSNAHGGKGVLLGGIAGITPAEVIVLGANTATEYIIRAAQGLGAVVKVFDNDINALSKLQNLFGLHLQTSVFHPQVLLKALKSADVVICACNGHETDLRYVVTEDMVRTMKKGSVIIDIGVAYGHVVETSECRTLQNPSYVKHGVIHYTVPNLPSRVPRTASIALSNILLPILLKTGRRGGINALLKEDKGLRQGVYLFNGILTNANIGKLYDIPSSDIDLLMAAF
ncbi:MAG: alanine dehydrogenase [Bacteroidales bacterium]|nr:alanine dehydrogenase [Bacteroidales bacterium]